MDTYQAKLHNKLNKVQDDAAEGKKAPWSLCQYKCIYLYINICKCSTYKQGLSVEETNYYRYLT